MSNLSGTLKAIQNIMRKDVGVDGLFYLTSHPSEDLQALGI